jgi:DNA repair photolyase
VALISRFDPWRSSLCTCPLKLTFNPYIGCDHACVYCYASSYIPRFADCRPKKDLIPKLKREAAKLKGEMISISNSSDLYPNLEAKTGLTRNCLEILSKHDCRIQIITKSDLVVRDLDLLGKIPSMVSVTITTDDDDMARLIEPHAPLPSDRLRAIETLTAKSIPTSVRIDPIIPFVNDNPKALIRTLASIGVGHITASTYKAKPGNWQRFSSTVPSVAEKLRPLYFERGEKINGYNYLPKDVRLQLMRTVSILAMEFGMTFGTCREGLSELNTAVCDGSSVLAGAEKIK